MSNIDIAALAAAAAEAEDQTKEVEHTEFNTLPPAGVTVGRLISYIELGVHDGGEYQGKKKPDAEKVRIEFELLGPQNFIEYEKDGEKHALTHTIEITMKKSLSEMAKFKKVFNKLSYGREDRKHMAQCIGDAYILTIHHNEGERNGKKRTYANLNAPGGEMCISPPFQVDPLSGAKQYYDIKPATRPSRLFLWDNPVQELWEALFIDGVREVKREDGTLVKESKNWLQDMMKSAKNFEGSALHQMLSGPKDDDLPELDATPDVPEAAPELSQTDLEEAIASVDVQSAPETEKPAPAALEEQPVDPMLALGLTLK